MWISPVQWHALWLGLFASIIAPFGGFFASGLKRAFKIKVSAFFSIFLNQGFIVVTNSASQPPRILVTVYPGMAALQIGWIARLDPTLLF